MQEQRLFTPTSTLSPVRQRHKAGRALIRYACTQIGADRNSALALLGDKFSEPDGTDPTKMRHYSFRGMSEKRRINETAAYLGYSKDSSTHWFRTQGWPLIEAVADQTFLLVEEISSSDQLSLFAI